MQRVCKCFGEIDEQKKKILNKKKKPTSSTHMITIHYVRASISVDRGAFLRVVQPAIPTVPRSLHVLKSIFRHGRTRVRMRAKKTTSDFRRTLRLRCRYYSCHVGRRPRTTVSAAAAGRRSRSKIGLCRSTARIHRMRSESVYILI